MDESQHESLRRYRQKDGTKQCGFQLILQPMEENISRKSNPLRLTFYEHQKVQVSVNVTIDLLCEQTTGAGKPRPYKKKYFIVKRYRWD